MNLFIGLFKVIPFCIAHFYCAHLITYNFIHYTYRSKHLWLGTGHNLAGGVGRWKQWGGGGGHIFFSQEKGGFIKY